MLRALLDEMDPLGSPAHQRVVEQRPGFEEYSQRKWASLSPVMWATIAVEMFSQPDQLHDLARVAVPDARDRRRAGRDVRRTVDGDRRHRA